MLPILFLLAADFTGRWTAPGPLNSEFVFILTQQNDSVSGTMTGNDRTFQIGNGKVDGDRISFSLMFPADGRLAHIPVTGELRNGALQVQLQGLRLTAQRIPPDPEAARKERLAGLIRVWGAIRFFHPYVAHGPIDWDGALVRAIPKVESSQTAEQYTAAVESMLAELHDPQTHVIRGIEAAAPAGERGPFRRLIYSGYPPRSGGGDYYWDWEIVAEAPPYRFEFAGLRIAMRTGEPASGPPPTIRSGESIGGGELPSRNERLLALAFYWTTIHYFYGHHEVIPDWDDTLTEFLPQFEAAATRRDYLHAIARLAGRTYDSHSIIGETWLGLGKVPDVAVRAVEGQFVVMRAGEAAKGIERGDAIVAIDGNPVEERRQLLMDLIPHSTPQAGLRKAGQWLLAANQPEATLRVRKPNGTESDIRVTRSLGEEPSLLRTGPTFRTLPNGSGYIDLTRLPASGVDRAFDAVMQTPSLILDVRGHPEVIFPAVAARLAAKAAVADIVTQRVWHGPDPALSVIQRSTQSVRPGAKPRYQGRVAALIDDATFSAGEHMCLYLEASAPVTFIGTPSSGAEGDITNLILPGQVQVLFSAREIQHADGRLVQRVGILPDIWAGPTIEGVRAGRDEILEKAVGWAAGPPRP
jgi:C-terminal processing protease CtpA/Prc